MKSTRAMRAVFLDRDGVLVEPVVRDGRPYPPERGNLKIFADAAEALARLKGAGFLLVVVTNQPDVVRGNRTRADIEAVNAVLAARLPIDDIFVCWHDDADDCACRKPKPGLLLEAAARYSIDLPASFMIGDRWRDVDAGAAAGCRTIWIDRRYREPGPSTMPDFRAVSLDEATDWILKRE
jgi:D-glycero-D-manno-heptose 1,7-bisphosphate phosphatase